MLLTKKDIKLKSFDTWHFIEDIDLIIADPPFAINFTGKPSNYNRKKDLVVNGYVEWTQENYFKNIINLLHSSYTYLKPTGSLLLFSGWQTSRLISQLLNYTTLLLTGKLYWNYNFAPACKKRPNHNVYEIFWLTKHPTEYTYNKNCSHSHCKNGEANLAAITIKKEFLKGIPKYPTRLPSELIGVLIEHFSNPNNRILDPMCGSGITGVICELLYPDREIYLGDLNPHSQIVYSALLNHFKEKWSLFDNLTTFLPCNKNKEN